MDKYIRLTLAGRHYRINTNKAKEAAGSAFAFACWLVGWGLFFSVMWRGMMK